MYFIFSKDCCQLFFSKEDNKSDRSKLEETKKTHTPRNAKFLRSFSNFVKKFIPNYRNYSTIKYAHTSLNRTLTKGSPFSLDWNL